MLDSVTKKRIDALRDILVGKVPDPKSQVEQITTGLIYKFMYDLDVESVEKGGVPSFFVGDYEKYSWKNLFDPKLGGADRVQLYSEAIEGMYTNPTAPRLFREIFKNSFLPFKDPSTLNMFLKEINEFRYSHSEKLGDAFEYLLSFMGSQGDAGQFRTPRHIIDFIVEIVNPQKNETILDPACGTAGFLISSYKHILSQNTEKELGDQLSASDRKKLVDNLVGYDISPDMTRISLVNMYLHRFTSPEIHEYDSLSSEDRWNEYYDVILANPPFFSPKGGIQPHSRFGVQSTRAEVLFVDYIMEHLKPKGRAGIVVPEGIIFQAGNAYKTLRKKLVEDCLVGVISLPAGVFQPYSGVKTSILILDKELNQKSDSIFFAKVENDGFSLGAQRNPIDENDLPSAVDKYLTFSFNQLDDDGGVAKQEILEASDCSLSRGKYLKPTINLDPSDFPLVKLREYTDLQRGTTITKKQIEIGEIPVIAGGKKPAYFHSQSNRPANSITISSSGAYAGFVSFHPYPIFASDCLTVVSKEGRLDQRFLFHLLKSRQDDIYKMQTGSGQPHVYARNFDDFEIPLPSIEIQQEIVDELEGYQKIIDGCRQVVENYKPTIDIDPSWEMVELGEISEVITKGTTPKTIGYEFQNEGVSFLKVESISDNGQILPDKLSFVNFECHHSLKRSQLEEGDILFSIAGSLGRTAIVTKDVLPANTNQALAIIRLKDKTQTKFVYKCLRAKWLLDRILENKVGVAQYNLSLKNIGDIEIPLPPIEVQQEIVDELEGYQKIIDGNKKFIDLYTQKIQDRISRVWGE